ncbi:hypothetical protein [Streptomyces swartbergensis]|uniref:hypothetical protein n=1 Tax=Streptomyces swartbergensis TaxID=487165 RepID=UPI0011802254|nr:hypothetical protein [Streptomyces swartbergensis]
MFVGEPAERLALSGGDEVEERLGDADCRVVVTNLGLVVPEHRESAEPADAVPAELDDFPQPSSGDHDDLPDVPSALIIRIVDTCELSEIVLVGQCACYLVGERASPLLVSGGASVRQRDDELPGQAKSIGHAVVHCLAEDLAGVVEDQRSCASRDDARFPIGPDHGQRREPMALAMPLICDEAVGVFPRQECGVVASARGVEFKERAQLSHRPANLVKGVGAVGAARRAQEFGKVVPRDVPQPPL